MITWKRVKSGLAGCVAMGAVAGAVLSIAGAQVPAPAAQGAGRGKATSMAEKVARADAIVVSKVADLQLKRYGVILYENGSNGTKPQMTTYYDLAVLHPEQVLKTDSASMVNKVDASNPVAWMHMAYVGKSDMAEGAGYVKPAVGDNQIWFMAHDTTMTGHYFLRDRMEVTAARIEEVKQIIAEQAKK